MAGGADGLVLAGDPAQDLIDVGAVHGLAFQQQLSEPVQGVAVLAKGSCRNYAAVARVVAPAMV